MVLVASYFFYALAGPSHVTILIAVTLLTHFGGLAIDRRAPGSYRLVWVAGVLAPLLIWKYLGWAAREIGVDAGADFMGIDLLHLALPVGISFYTLQAAGYLIDVGRGRSPPPKSLMDTALYLAFFPQVLAGPIERGGVLVPQLQAFRTPASSEVARGAKVLLWGYFAKLVLADGVARLIDESLLDKAGPSGASLWIVCFLYSFQIYFDFLGYTTIARGLAQLLGVRLSRNFDAPYTATSIQDFWRRWHITLTSWFRDYVYIPLGGRQRGKAVWFVAVVLVFLLSGLWHGAAFNFLVWGGVHALLYSVGRQTTGARARLGHALRLSIPSSVGRLISMLSTFTLVSLAWVPFRLATLDQVKDTILTMFGGLASIPWATLSPVLWRADAVFIVGICLFFLWADGSGLVRRVTETIPATRRGIAAEIGLVNTMSILLLLIGDLGTREFIYFRF